MIDLSFHLQAKNPERNIARRYSMLLTQDLFGAWILKITFGCSGRKGTEMSYAFPSKEGAYQKLKPILKKRASAQNRLGCPYQLIEYHRHPSLRDIDVLPVLTKFSSSKRATKFPSLISKPKETKRLPLFDRENSSDDLTF
jgi:WGR domain